MIEEPKISVIIPVYNVEKYLSKCIESVLVQDNLCEIEIILIDDGSLDKSSNICEEYESKFDNIRVIHKTNEGLGYARNSGLDVAKGKYIFFLDSDDWIPKATLGYLFDVAERNSADVVCFQYIMTPKDDIIVSQSTDFEKTISTEECIKEYLLGKNVASTAWSKFYRRDIFHSIRFSNVPIHEDAYSMHEFLGMSKRTVITNRICYVQRVRQGSLINSRFDRNRFISEECGTRCLSYVQKKYPNLIPYAYFHLIERQLGLLKLIITSFQYRTFKKEYERIRDELCGEYSMVIREGWQLLNPTIWHEVEMLCRHPLLFCVYSLLLVMYRNIRSIIGDFI